MATGFELLIARAEGLGVASARTVRWVLLRTRTTGVDLRAAASQVSTAHGKAEIGGAFWQVAGHAFEVMDVTAYRVRGVLRGKKLVLVQDASHAAVDALRFEKGRFAGAVQHKLSANGIGVAVQKCEAQRPGSFRWLTVRLPRGEVARATGGGVRKFKRIQESTVSRADVIGAVRRGSKRILRLGAGQASSVTRAALRSAGFAAAASAGVGALFDLRRLRRGEVSRRSFVEARAIEVSEAGTGAAVGTVVAAGLATAGAGVVSTFAIVTGSVLATSWCAGRAANKLIVRLRRDEASEPFEGVASEAMAA